MNFALTTSLFHYWYHIRDISTLEQAQSHLNTHGGRGYFLFYKPELVVPSMASFYSALFIEVLEIEKVVCHSIPLDLTHAVEAGPVQLIDLKQPHQIRLKISNTQDRALRRFFLGSSFSPSLWRIIPSDHKGQPLARDSHAFLQCLSMCPPTIHLLGLEDGRNGEHIGQTLFL
jgi:hypothetical protein